MSATLTMMHIAYAGPHAAKRMARDGRVAVKTAEKWWQSLTTPRADVLLRLAQENQALRELMMKALSGETYVDGVPAPMGAQAAAESGAAAREGKQAGGTDRDEAGRAQGKAGQAEAEHHHKRAG